jgi:hypothetical protein
MFDKEQGMKRTALITGGTGFLRRYLGLALKNDNDVVWPGAAAVFNQSAQGLFWPRHQVR